MRHRREPGEVELEVPIKFGLAQLYLLRAENFFQLVSSPKKHELDHIMVRDERRPTLLRKNTGGGRCTILLGNDAVHSPSIRSS